MQQSHVIFMYIVGPAVNYSEEWTRPKYWKVIPDQFHYPDLRIFYALVFVILVEVIN